MKSIITSAVATLLALPAVVSAQGFSASGGEIGTLLENIILFANDVLIPFILGLGFLFFVWGMFRYFIMGGADEESREKGKSLMLWALIGFVLIIVFWGIVNLVASSTGWGGQTLQNIPSVIGVEE
mgnify:FL=1